MRVLDIGTGSIDAAPPGAEMIDGNVIEEDDPEEKILCEWVAGDPTDSLKGPYDMIMMTHSLRYNQEDYEAISGLSKKFIDRIWELTQKGSWMEIVDYPEGMEGNITPEEYRVRFIEPLLTKGFKCRVEGIGGDATLQEVFFRLERTK